MMRTSSQRVAYYYMKRQAAKSLRQDFQAMVTHFKSKMDKAKQDVHGSLEMIARWFFKGTPFYVVNQPVVQMTPTASAPPHIQVEVVPAEKGGDEKDLLRELRSVVRGAAEVRDTGTASDPRFEVTWHAEWK